MPSMVERQHTLVMDPFKDHSIQVTNQLGAELKTDADTDADP